MTKKGIKQVRRTWEQSIQLLKKIGTQEMKAIAQDEGVSESSLRSWLWRFARRADKMQGNLNELRNLQKNNKRVRKFTTIGTLQVAEEEVG